MDVDAIAVRGDWIRHAPHRSELLSRSAMPTDGRWQRADVVRGLYLADGPQTAVAEWYRVLAELGLPPEQSVPHDHHHWEVDLSLADLSSPERLASVGLATPLPSRRSWSEYQAVGEHLYRAGWAGVLAPSAARPAALIACVFDTGSWPPTGCRPIRSVEIVAVPAPPTGMTT